MQDGLNKMGFCPGSAWLFSLKLLGTGDADPETGLTDVRTDIGTETTRYSTCLKAVLVSTSKKFAFIARHSER